MAKAKAKAAKKQADLPAMEGPGVAPVRIAAIDALADDYIRERDKRVRLTPREVAAKQKLVDALHENAQRLGTNPDGAIVYRYDTIVLTLSPGKEKLQVKDISEDTDEVELG
jgi:hypothetical protein